MTPTPPWPDPAHSLPTRPAADGTARYENEGTVSATDSEGGLPPDMVGVTRTGGRSGPDAEEFWVPPGYEFLGLLGRGGMGVVYQARERAADRVVALKLVRAGGGSQDRERFAVEVKALAGLRHPNIVQVYAVALDGPAPFFTMEYVPGGGLDRRLRAHGPLPPAEAVRILRAVARAVAAAHAAGVVHRDLKPGNILLAPDGTPKVTDFGLAKRLGRDDDLTATGAMLGTPGYMAPEQAGRRNREVGPAADVYALGATLYALLTGQAPFSGDTPLETAARVVSDPPLPPRRLRPELPRDLEAVVLKCLEKEPERRYRSAGELADELDRWGRGEPTVTRPPSALGRARRAVGRHARRAALLAALVLLAAAAGVGLFRDRERPPDPPGPPPQPGDGRIRDALARGEAVTLIGPTGLPAWHRFAFLPAQLGESVTGDGTCAFQTMDFTLLELVSDPGVSRYRFEAELRHLRGRGPLNREDPQGLESVGVYFGADALPPARGQAGTTLFAVTFNDYPPRPNPQVGPAPQLLRLNPGLLLQSPERTPGSFWSEGAAVPFAPAPERPGPWRQIRVDVGPDGVAVTWRPDPSGPEVPVASWDGAEARKRYAALQGWLDKAAPGAGLAARPWQPRMPLGVWCNESAVAVRNVRIAPR